MSLNVTAPEQPGAAKLTTNTMQPMQSGDVGAGAAGADAPLGGGNLGAPEVAEHILLSRFVEILEQATHSHRVLPREERRQGC